MCISPVAFDTLAFVEQLKKAGAPETQAISDRRGKEKAFFQVLELALATKADLMAVKSDPRAGMSAAKSELQSELKLLKWMLVILVSVLPTMKVVSA